MIPISIFIILTLGILQTGAFKILVFFPMPSYSHQRAILSLTERLVSDGHELFVISPNAVPGLESHANYTYVDVSFAYEYFGDPDKDKNKDEVADLQTRFSKWELPRTCVAVASIARKEFESEAFRHFIRRVETERIQFDVAIIETWFTPFTCALTRLISGSTPIISMSTVNADIMAEDSLGSISHLSFVPAIFGEYTHRMSLWQKIENWVYHFYLTRAMKNAMDPAARVYFRDNFGPSSERLVDGCWSNASLSIVVSNSVYSYPRLLGPNVIETGPLHLKPPGRLPKNLQDWLDGAEKGVIFFSLGSNMRSKSLPVVARDNLMKFFKELPKGYRVLWKWELDGRIPGQSDNILTQKWMPQESVLAHPKVRVFITQGGLQSFQEAVHYGVPTVGIPWFGDQEFIAAKMVDAGVGAQLLPSDLYSYEKIKAALDMVLYDKRFFKNMQRLSAISRDFTAQAMDKAVFWVEHVARHGGATHLRPATADTSLFQYFCLDIITVILFLSSLIMFATYKVSRFVILFMISNKLTKKIKNS
ncbi:unnamed protein product [Bemisia tabaci]|uniref:UDP-glucuronosyltransferase n=1 Tax=Bemisia tabaci TaxID=7038 RepID=A0A9P0AMH4_BEMTA|nr:unnamed protein product [Bemisia tabaci]